MSRKPAKGFEHSERGEQKGQHGGATLAPWLVLYQSWLKTVVGAPGHWRDGPGGPGPRRRAMGLLVMRFEPLVCRLTASVEATDFATRCAFREELRQIGRMGVVRAVEAFNREKREAFPVYAKLRIYKEILDEQTRLRRGHYYLGTVGHSRRADYAPSLMLDFDGVAAMEDRTAEDPEGLLIAAEEAASEWLGK